MKTRILIFTLIVFGSIACSKSEDPTPAHRLSHTGEKWRISSVEFTIVDQSLTNPAQWVKTGTATDAGAFYFNGSDGSFDILIDNQRQEDYFGYSINGAEVSIITVDQSISPSKISQNVIAITGDQDGNTMLLSGTFTRQGTMQQYVFTGDFVLTKE